MEITFKIYIIKELYVNIIIVTLHMSFINLLPCPVVLTPSLGFTPLFYPVSSSTASTSSVRRHIPISSLHLSAAVLVSIRVFRPLPSIQVVTLRLSQNFIDAV